MSSPLEQAGATREPSEYAALSMDRGITGLWTQRSPLRDADVPYLYGKFYSASRFDSLIDGVNREITSKLTYARRPGSSVFNSNGFAPINSFYSFKRILNGVEVIDVLADVQDAILPGVYNITGNTKTFVMGSSGGAGKNRFEAVGTSLYIANGVDKKKWLQPAGWVAQTGLDSTQYEVGTTVIDSNGDLQYLYQMGVGSVTNVQVAGNVAILTFSGTNFGVTQGMSFFVTGLTVATFLNSKQLIASSVVPSGANFIVTAVFPHAPLASTADSGSSATRDVGTPAVTGGTQPSWATGGGNFTADGMISWLCIGGTVFDWAPAGPNTPPMISKVVYTNCSMTFWQPLTAFPLNATIVSSEGQIWRCAVAGQSGARLPELSSITKPVADGGVSWQGSTWLGGGSQPAPWQSGVTPSVIDPSGGDVIVDSNGNLQIAVSGSGATGGSAPTWATAYGSSTTDSGLTWSNLGPYMGLAFQGWQYGFAYHSIDGSVSTLSPLTPSTNGVIDGVNISGPGIGVVSGGFAQPIIDFIWIFRTADGESTPLFIAAVPNPGVGNTWSYNDQNTDEFLVAELPGPQAESNNPPPIGITAPCYHLGRICAVYQNTVIMSGGPDTLVGNGNTAFPPGSSFPIPEQPVRLFSGMTSQGPALFIFGRVNVYTILGQGTTNSPFQQASRYMENCGILNYDAITQIGSTYYAFGNSALVGSNIVGKAWSLDPAAGYVEYGFPIGDQFQNVTTGAGGKVPNSSAPLGYLYNPASTFVTWAELGSGDTGLYVADGSAGWFRYSPVASPESGFLWSPRAIIAGGTSAVQAVETQPGVIQLLIGPQSSGPILFRDSTTNQDNGTSYPSYDVKGCIQLCLTGELAEIAHIHLVSMPEGARPSIGILPDEILASMAAPFTWLDPTSAEPPDLRPLQSKSVYSDRYSVMQKGVTGKCMFFQLGMDYGTQNEPDETLMFSIYGAKYAERRQQ